MRLAVLALASLGLPFAAAANSAEPAAAESYVSARAVVRAGESVDIAAGLSRRLTSAPFKPGRFVERGAVIARFDCARLRADLLAREQAVRTLSLRYESELELESFGAAGALDVRVAESERDQAKAEAAAIRASLDDCVIHAPFNALVSARHVSAHETPQVGEPVYTLIRAGDVELSVIVPARLGATLRAGQGFTVRMDGSDADVKAKVTRLAPDIDPVSQTREIYAAPASRSGLKPGMSGEARFNR